MTVQLTKIFNVQRKSRYGVRIAGGKYTHSELITWADSKAISAVLSQADREALGNSDYQECKLSDGTSVEITSIN